MPLENWLKYLWTVQSFSSVQLLSHVRHFVTLLTAARQAFLSITNFRSLLKLVSIELLMPSTTTWWWLDGDPAISSSVVPFSSCIQSFPAPGSFQMIQFFASDSQSNEVSASTSVLQMCIQNWFPLRLTGWISLQSKGPSRVFSNTTVQKHQFFSTQLSLSPNSHIHTWLLETIALTRWTFIGKVMSLLFNIQGLEKYK